MADLAPANLLAEPGLARAGRARVGQFGSRATAALGSSPTMAEPLVRVLATPAAQRAAVAGGLVGVLGVAVSAVGVAPLLGGRAWWFSLPPDWLNRAGLLSALFYSSIALWMLCWLTVGLGVRARHWRVRGLSLLAGWWSAPLVVAPVALSTDAYTYLGQGLVAADGLNPYRYGPGSAMLPPRLQGAIPWVWLGTPSPYGPLFVRIVGTIAPLARSHLVYAVVAIRLVEVAGLALIAVALPRLATALGADPNRAVWLGVTSPLALGSFVLSAHNDALMLGLLICGLAVATRDRRVAGIPPVLLAVALCTLAAMIKAPAGIAVLFLALAWARRVSSRPARLARVGLCAGVAGVVMVVCTALSGVGWAWVSVGALSSPARVSTPFTPATAITNALVGLGRLIGFALPRTQVLHAVLGVTVAAALAFTGGLLIRHHRIGTARALGLSLLTVVLAAPVTWPWYLCWGVVLLAAAMPARRVLGLILLASAPLLLVQPDGDAQELGIAATTLLAAASLVLAGYTVRWCVRHFRPTGPGTPTSGEARR
jgi:hypothetical protein